MLFSMNASSRSNGQNMIDPRLEEIFHNGPGSADSMKRAVLASLIFMLILIWMPMPRFAAATVIRPNREKPRPVHHQFRVRPEQIQPRQELIRKKSRTFPVPDPTPLEREPHILPDKLQQPQIVATGDINFEVPDLPTAGETPLSAATPGLEMPVVTRRVSPNYPTRGLKIALQGYVIVEAVLGRDGKVRDTRIVRSLGGGKFGFEEQAVTALKQWEFLPGVLNGKPVDVRMNLRIDFRITR